MEVCYKCHEEIKQDQKSIVGDPNIWTKVVAAGFESGVNSSNKKRIASDIRTNDKNYHLECYEKAKKDDARGALWLSIFLVTFAVIVLIIVFAVVLPKVT